MNKNTYIVIGVIVVALLLLVIGIARIPRLGGIVHNVAELFVNGVVVGSNEKAGCIKIRDKNNSQWYYLYLEPTLGTVTASTSVPFTGACGGI